MTPARVSLAMLLSEPRLDRKAFELHTVALQRLTGGGGERPARRCGPRVLLGDPLEMDLARDDSGVGAPRSEGAIVPLADGGHKHVKLGRLELLELASGAFLTGNARDKRDVRRALHAAEQVTRRWIRVVAMSPADAPSASRNGTKSPHVRRVLWLARSPSGNVTCQPACIWALNAEAVRFVDETWSSRCSSSLTFQWKAQSLACCTARDSAPTMKWLT